MRQESLFGSDVEQEEALLSHLLQRARLYNESESYKGLLEFVGRLPHLAPFNALLVNIQKPGLRFAAFEHEWSARFKRTIKEGARPLVVLWPFAPVAFVYDVADTEGEPLPEAVECAFRATGSITHGRIKEFSSRLAKMGIYVYRVEYGDGLAGSIGFDRVAAVRQSILAKTRPDYRLCLNARHDPNVQFATIVHELGHLFLGHLGQDAYLKIPGEVVSRPRRKRTGSGSGFLPGVPPGRS